MLQKDALTKWEKKHPGQKKVCTACTACAACALHVRSCMDAVCTLAVACTRQAPSKARAASGGGGGGGGGAMGDMFFTMMDKDKDGTQ